MKLKELCIKERYEQLAQRLPQCHHDYMRIVGTLKLLESDVEWVTREYCNSRDRLRSLFPQRKFDNSQKGYQGMSTGCMKFLLHGHVFEEDIVNAFPTFILFSFKQAGINTPILREYVDRRDEIIQNIMKT